MRLPEFSSLPESIQLDELHKDGAYIGKRKRNARTVLLFQYESFYVEIYYTSYRKEIDHLVVSDDMAVLDPYLEQMPVSFQTERGF